MIPKASLRGRIKASGHYLRFRGLYYRSKLKAKYNEFLDRTLGWGVYDAEMIVDIKRKRSKKYIQENKKGTNSIIRKVEKMGVNGIIDPDTRRFT